MSKTILKAAAVGVVVGLIVGLSLNLIPVLDNLVPDNYKGFITGGIAGMFAALMISQGKNPSA